MGSPLPIPSSQRFLVVDPLPHFLCQLVLFLDVPLLAGEALSAGDGANVVPTRLAIVEFAFNGALVAKEARPLPGLRDEVRAARCRTGVDLDFVFRGGLLFEHFEETGHGSPVLSGNSPTPPEFRCSNGETGKGSEEAELPRGPAFFPS